MSDGEARLEMIDLEVLVARLVQACQPERVVLCPGAGRDAGVLDLLVVQRTRQRFRARRVEVLTALPADRPVEVLVYTPEEIEEMCRRDNPFVILALEQGEELYCRPET